MELAPRRRRRSSCRKSDVDDVAVLNGVVLSFQAYFAVIATRGHRAARDQRIVAHDLCAYDPPRDIAVNFARGELGRKTARDRPGAALVFPHGKKRDVAEEIV